MAAVKLARRRGTASVLAAALACASGWPAAARAETPSRAPAAFLPVPSTAASPLVRLWLDLQAGYDNDLLADPDRIGILEPLSAWLGGFGPALHARRSGLFTGQHRDRGEAHLEAHFADYSEAALGRDWSASGSLLYQADLSARSRLEASAAFERFRRPELPLFDVDAPLARLRLAHRVGARGLVAGELGYARPAYPGRALGGGAHQQDDRFDVGVSCLRSFDRQAYAALRAAWREVDSNDPELAQHGPLVELRAGGAVAGGQLSAAVAYSARRYPDYPVLRTSGPPLMATGDTRRDDVLQIALTLARAVTRRVTLYAQGLGVHQWSNVEALAFGQARAVVGLQVELWRAGLEDARAAGQPAAAPPPLAPVVAADGATFRVRAPGAQQVALVGGFNAWDATRAPMRGPDADGVWWVTVSIPAGVWRYAFVVDGRWVRPEGAPRYEDNGFGDENGVLDVEEPPAPGGEP